MISRLLKAKLASSRHPAETVLFLYLEGELPDRKSRKVRAHLQTCWDCRVQVDDMVQGIGRAVRLRNELAEALPGRWETGIFDRQVAELLRHRERVPWWRNLLRLGRLPVHVAAAAVVILCVLFWLRLGSPARVSAHELCKQADAAEHRLLSPLVNPVIHQKIRISRRMGRNEQTSTIETWTDVRLSRRERRGGNGLWGELTGILGTKRAKSRPLSASSYREWTNSLPVRKQTVETRELSDGSRAWVIRTITEPAAVRPYVDEAELVLRQSDLHPVQENLKVIADNGDRHYELTELAFDVVPASSVGPDIFHDTITSRPRKPELPIRTFQTLTPVPSLNPAPPRALTAELTVEALYVLHQMRACAGEPFEVIQAGGDVAVRGLVESSARKEELTAALRNLPELRLEILTIDEAVRRAAVPQAFEAAVIEAHRGEDYLSRLVDKRLTPAQLTAIANLAVSQSNAWLMDAWELRRLSETFPEAEVQKLGPATLSLLEKIIRDHTESIGRHAFEFRLAAHPIMAGPLQDVPAWTPASWPSAAGSIFDAAVRSHQTAQVLFTGEGILNEPPEATFEHLISCVLALEESTRDLTARVPELLRAVRNNPTQEVRKLP
jgi:hypothetical protein